MNPFPEILDPPLSVGLYVLYFKGLLVKMHIKLCISVPEDCFYLLSKETVQALISSGYSLLAKLPSYQYQK